MYIIQMLNVIPGFESYELWLKKILFDKIFELNLDRKTPFKTIFIQKSSFAKPILV